MRDQIGKTQILVRDSISPAGNHLGGYSLGWEDPEEHLASFVVRIAENGGFYVGSLGVLTINPTTRYPTQEEADVAAYREAIYKSLDIIEVNALSGNTCRTKDNTNNPDDMRLGGRKITTL